MTQHATTSVEHATAQRGRYWRLISRFAAASVVATGISQVVFLTSYVFGSAPVISTVLAWLAGAIPNFVLNRRTWGGGGQDALRGEVLRYGVISVGTAVLAAFATHSAEDLAIRWFAHSEAAQVGLVWAAFVGTYLVMFVLKFFLVDRLVFTAHRRQEQAR